MITNMVPVRSQSRKSVTAETETPAAAHRPFALPVGRGLLRVEEAAEWLGLGRTKAYELVYRGTLPSVTIGRSRRVPVAALEAFVQQLMQNGGVL